MSRIKLICCDVFARLAYAAAASSDHIVDVELLPMLAHMEPARLNDDLRARVSRAEADRYDRLALGYGLCGNATAGLCFPVITVMPRTHDCCAVFMGSQKGFITAFGGNLSTRWCSCGYYERGYSVSGLFDDSIAYRTHPEYLKLLEDYGEDNAEYVWQTMHPPMETGEAVYIRLDGYEYGGGFQLFKRQIERGGHSVRVEKGDPAWFFRLVNGPWSDEEFLTIKPGEKVTPVYDLREVARAVRHGG